MHRDAIKNHGLKEADHLWFFHTKWWVFHRSPLDIWSKAAILGEDGTTIKFTNRFIALGHCKKT